MLAIFVFETNSTCKSDYLYVDKLLKFFYETQDLVIKPIYLNGKGNYSKQSTIKKINSVISMYKSVQRDIYEIKVFYFIDTDNTDLPENHKLNNDIDNFCKANKYNLIWFCKCIEQVFLKKTIHKSEKSKISKSFSSQNLTSIDINKLMLNDYLLNIEGTSNIINVFNACFIHKR